MLLDWGLGVATGGVTWDWVGMLELSLAARTGASSLAVSGGEGAGMVPEVTSAADVMAVVLVVDVVVVGGVAFEVARGREVT